MHLGQEHVADYTIGWRPRAKLVRGAVRPGILGVFQAEHNLLVRFHAFPHVANLAIAQPTTLRLTGGRRPFGDRSMASVHIKASPEGALRRFARPILGGAPMFFVVRSVQG